MKRLAKNDSVVICQKEILPPDVLSYLQSQGIRVYYDIDDAIFLDYTETNEKRQFVEFLERVEHVFVSTRYLNEQLEGSYNGSLLPTPVHMQPEVWKSKKGSTPLVFGWIGSPSTEDNLDLVIPIFDELSKSFDFNVKLLGVANPSKYARYKWCEAVKWLLPREVEWLKIMDYGLAPLKDSVWNQGKGGYKINLYMSAGIPVLTSPIGINKDLVKHQVNGELCASAEDWKNSLTRLLNNELNYFSLSEAAYTECNRRYSYEACFQHLWTVLDNN